MTPPPAAGPKGPALRAELPSATAAGGGGTPTPQRLRIGHTPDMDDAFMFFAMAEGKIPMDGIAVEHVIEDIHTLNERARKAELDLTAISVASFPMVSTDYWMMSVGSSVGQGYGPVLISRTPQSLQALRGCRIGVPGLHTTACVLLQMALPSCVPVAMAFERIPEAVQQGEVTAGVVIHEWQLTYQDAGLLPVMDLGMWWQQQVKLPLPLGVNVIKKSLGVQTARRAAALLKASLLYGFAHQEEAIAYAMRYGRGTDAVRATQFINMYVNEESLAISHPCREALREFFKRAAVTGLIPRVPPLEIIEPY